MITPDSTLREISAAAFAAGFSITITPVLVPTRADRITAEYGPRGHCWRWRGPWRRFESYWPYEDKRRQGWERMFEVPDIDMADGTAHWPGESERGWGSINIISLFDEPFPDYYGWGTATVGSTS